MRVCSPWWQPVVRNLGSGIRSFVWVSAPEELRIQDSQLSRIEDSGFAIHNSEFTIHLRSPRVELAEHLAGARVDRTLIVRLIAARYRLQSRARSLSARLRIEQVVVPAARQRRPFGVARVEVVDQRRVV